MRRWRLSRRWPGYVDIWLADYKYADGALAAELSAAQNYPAVADAALRQMLLQTGAPVYDADGYLQKGVIVRHLALPGPCGGQQGRFAAAGRTAGGNGRRIYPEFDEPVYPFL